MRGCLLAAAVALLLAGAVPDARQATFRTGVRTVAIYATVSDREGRLVPDLDRAAFEIRDYGRPAPVTVFSNESQAITVAVMLDMSGSMEAKVLRVRTSSLSFVAALAPGDRARIGTFGDEVAISPLLTGDRDILGRVLQEEVWPGGGTPLWKAIDVAMTSLAGERGRRVVLVLSPRFDTEWPELHRAARLVWDSPRADRVGPSPLWDGVETAVQALEAERGRRAIVMVTDGRSTGNVHGMAEVTTHALLADVSINVIAAPTGMFLRQDETTYARVRPTVLLEQRAGATGGAYAELRGSEDVAPFLVRGISRLHELYTIGFPPMAWDRRTHGIAVRVKRPGVTVRAKTGYVADRPPQIPPG